MHKKIIVIGALCCALAVALGAFGAHALKSILTPESLQSFHTATNYQMLHGIAAAYSMGGTLLWLWNSFFLWLYLLTHFLETTSYWVSNLYCVSYSIGRASYDLGLVMFGLDFPKEIN
jgi:uncharacterized membrane protein YgdD (TMEM256/DUF423 family)